MVRSSDDIKVQHAFESLLKTWNALPRLERLQFELREDASGDPSVFVLAVLEEKTPEEQWTTEQLQPMINLVQQTVQKAGIDRWVYVRFARPSDLVEKD